MLLRRILPIVICLSMTLCCNAQSKLSISDTCDVLKLWGGEKIYCHVKEINDHSVLYWPCSDSAKFLKSIWRNRVHLLVHPSNSYIVVTEDSISNMTFGSLPDGIGGKDISIKKIYFINGGLGNSSIGVRVYSSNAGAVISQGIVYNVSVDYGISKNVSVGPAYTYQELKGTPVIPASQGVANVTENISRNNGGIRILTYLDHTEHLQFYTGVRVGLSYWRDIVSDPFYQRSATMPDKSLNPSIQCLAGLRVMEGFVGLHAEIAVGAPYIVMIGASFKI